MYSAEMESRTNGALRPGARTGQPATEISRRLNILNIDSGWRNNTHDQK